MRRLHLILHIFLVTSEVWCSPNYFSKDFGSYFENSQFPRHERHHSNENRQARILAEYLSQMRRLEDDARENILGHFQKGSNLEDPKEDFFYRHPLLLLMEIQEQISSMNHRDTEENQFNQVPENTYHIKDSTKEALLRNSWPERPMAVSGINPERVGQTEFREIEPHHRGSRDVNSVINTNCHTANLKRCGRAVIEGFNPDLDFTSRCKIRKEFLDCMVRMREKGCDQLSRITIEDSEDAATIRNQIRKLLWSANGCVLGYEA